MITTCQICARQIKTRYGSIAHHGYKRPGGGWQTASCYGASYWPYEISCDRIKPAIAFCERSSVGNAKEIAGMNERPSESYSFQAKTACGEKRGDPIRLDRPQDFDPHSPPDILKPRTYEREFFTRRRWLANQITQNTAEIEYLTKRLANWIAPAGAEAAE